MWLRAALTSAAVFGLALLWCFWPSVSDASGEELQAVFVVGEKRYLVGNETRFMDVAPFVEQGRTYVPIRYLAYSLGVPGWAVFWDEQTRVAYLYGNGTGVFLTIGGPGLLVLRGRDAALVANGLLLEELPRWSDREKALAEAVRIFYEYPELAQCAAVALENSALASQLFEGILTDIFKRAEFVPTDVAPVIRQERTFLPARFVAEAFGFTVSWDHGTQTVRVFRGGSDTGQRAGSGLSAEERMKLEQRKQELELAISDVEGKIKKLKNGYRYQHELIENNYNSAMERLKKREVEELNALIKSLYARGLGGSPLAEY
ncbi:copper amine oxidase N-terminal domain-containing protein [Desulfothermobacter acidiphilus]|uniref:copper amine oxidase N-terminal domain-containing protein n=1 Tax=Desulfothermobacter acidiphilus TaxID=1938353 RepID=UPI003F8BE56C